MTNTEDARARLSEENRALIKRAGYILSEAPFAGWERAWNALLDAARDEGPRRVAQAFYEGAMAALGCDWWEEAPDFFAVTSQSYARGEPLPPTMPKRREEGRPAPPPPGVERERIKAALFDAIQDQNPDAGWLATNRDTIWVSGGCTPQTAGAYLNLADIADAVIAALQREGEQDPVAWAYELARSVKHHEDGNVTFHNFEIGLSRRKPCVPKDSIRNLTPLFAALQPPHAGVSEPIPMLLFCPKCGLQHIDAPEHSAPRMNDAGSVLWDNPPHRSHLCHGCGHIWRPADVPTEGVAAITTRGKNDSGPVQPPHPDPAGGGEWLTLANDAADALASLCARYGYEPDGVTLNDWSEWAEARRVRDALRAMIAAAPGDIGGSLRSQPGSPRNQESGSVEGSSGGWRPPYPFCHATRREACIAARRCTADPVCND